jgi:hypothetical protein
MQRTTGGIDTTEEELDIVVDYDIKYISAR